MKALAIGLLLLSPMAMAWDGYDSDSGSDIEIGGGNLVREGESIEYYDSETGDYHTGSVESVDSTYGGVEVEVYDDETGEYRTFEMEDD